MPKTRKPTAPPRNRTLDKHLEVENRAALAAIAAAVKDSPDAIASVFSGALTLIRKHWPDSDGASLVIGLPWRKDGTGRPSVVIPVDYPPPRRPKAAPAPPPFSQEDESGALGRWWLHALAVLNQLQADANGLRGALARPDHPCHGFVTDRQLLELYNHLESAAGILACAPTMPERLLPGPFPDDDPTDRKGGAA